MEKLRVLDYLTNIEELGQEAMSANVTCSCGSNLFSIQHTGKQTKGILAPHLLKKDQQLIAKAICKACGQEIIVYNSEIDGTHRSHSDVKHPIFTSFQLSKFKSKFFQIKMMYNYYPDYFKENEILTNEFEMIFIDISNDEVKKAYRLIEE